MAKPKKPKDSPPVYLRTLSRHYGINHKDIGKFILLTSHSKNLFNSVNYLLRQIFTALHKLKSKPSSSIQPETIRLLFTLNDFIEAYNIKHNKTYPLLSTEVRFLPKDIIQSFSSTLPQYQPLYSQTAQQVTHQVYRAWKGFFALHKAFKSGKISHLPRLPHYLKKKDFNIIFFSNQQIKREGKYFKLSCKDMTLKVKAISETVKEIRLIPTRLAFKVEYVYEKALTEKKSLNQNNMASLDMGVNNLIAFTTNTGCKPLIFSSEVGGLNQWYNKKKTFKQSNLKIDYNQHSSKSLLKMDEKRERIIENEFHLISKRLISYLIEENIGTLIIGKNKGWKQNVNMGKVNNQNFVQLPLARLIDILTYKAQAEGILVVEQEESYTSKASCLSADEIPVYDADNKETYTFSGKRVKGLYLDEKVKKTIHSDINGSYNIGRKFNPSYKLNWLKMDKKEFMWHGTPLRIPVKALSLGKSVNDFLREKKVARLTPNL